MPRLRVLVAAWAMRINRVNFCGWFLVAWARKGAWFGYACALTFVGSLFELLVVGRLLDNVQDGVGQLREEVLISFA